MAASILSARKFAGKFCHPPVQRLIRKSSNAFDSHRQASTAAFSVNSTNTPADIETVSVVQGASRGIGLEFVRQLLTKENGGQVIATCRNPHESEGLLALASEFKDRLTALQLDVTDEDSIAAAAGQIKDKFGKVHVLVNASGVLHIQNKLKPETALARLDPSAMLLTYQINAAGPILVIKHMHSLLKLGGKTSAQSFSVVANISARVSSIGDNSIGGWYSYRASKTALNQLTKTAAIEFKRRKDPIVPILLHPGTVDTELSKPFQGSVPQGKLFSPAYSVGRMLDIVQSVGVDDAGKFFAWDGQEIPW